MVSNVSHCFFPNAFTLGNRCLVNFASTKISFTEHKYKDAFISSMKHLKVWVLGHIRFILEEAHLKIT